jgi:Putative Actinobacterial Holin-X, holin superfamily III
VGMTIANDSTRTRETDVDLESDTTPRTQAPAPGVRTDSRRLPALIRSIASDVSLLVRQQKDLARQELGEIAGEKAKGAGLLAAAAVLGLFVIGFLGLAGAEALDLAMPRWAAFLVVGGAFLLLAILAGLIGRRALAARTTPERTKETLKEDVEWAKQQLKR